MHPIRDASTALVLCFFLGFPVIAGGQQRSEQERRASDPPVLIRNLRGVLGGVPMAAADSMHNEIVGRLDFQSYKAILRGLTAFGDREQGTARNAAANDWIEDQLRGWGYETERVHYVYTLQRLVRHSLTRCTSSAHTWTAEEEVRLRTMMLRGQR